jgi:hypothetical protein
MSEETAKEPDVSVAIKALFDQGVALKHDGKQVEALKVLDETQQMIKLHFGEDSEKLIKVYFEITVICNVLAMAHLQREDYKLC